MIESNTCSICIAGKQPKTLLTCDAGGHIRSIVPGIVHIDTPDILQKLLPCRR